MSKILVLGGAGFIGSHIVELLLYNGHDIVVFDNFSRGAIENLSNVLESPRLKVIRGDIRNRNELAEVMEDIDIVINQVGLWWDECQKDNQKCLDVNVVGMSNVLNIAVEKNVTRIVFASSSAVYGEANYLPLDEKHPLNDASFYSQSKIFSENLLKAFHNEYGIEYVILRYMNAYGPRQDYRRYYAGLVMKSIDDISNGVSPTIIGSSSRTLDLTYVSDIADANVLAASSKVKTGIYNISTNIETSLKNIVMKISELISKDVSIQEIKSDSYYIQRRVASYNKAFNELGYTPKITFSEGIKKTIIWYNKTKEKKT